MSDTFPRQYARTQRLTLGDPRTITVSPDDRRVVFLRSASGSDPVNCLWVMDSSSGEERLVADPRQLLTPGDDTGLPPEERARRERSRESAGGVVAYATDSRVSVAAFALGGRLFAAGLIAGRSRELVVDGPVFDPRPDPAGTCVAYVSGPSLRIAELDGSSRELAGPDGPEVTWGSAEFIAGEEMNRHRGYWWAPDGSAIAACRVDNSPVGLWWIGDPANPDREPTRHRYPAAGTANAVVELHVLPIGGGDPVPVRWDAATFPYLATVSWSNGGLLLSVLTRNQRELVVLRADPATGETSELWRDTDDAWVELVPGSPSLLPDGRLVVAADRGGARRLLVNGEVVSPPELQVRGIVSATEHGVVVSANAIGDATGLQAWRWHEGSFSPLADSPGVSTVTVGRETIVVRTASLDRTRPVTYVLGGPELPGYSEEPLVSPNVQLFELGPRRLTGAVLLPAGCPDDARLPVLLDPYAGPHAQRVLASRSAFLSSQWLADQGFAVVVIDGRGTPGRGTEWERAIHRDLAGPVLEDQIDGLAHAAALVPQLDLTRVAIRGWSFGGYLAALAILRRPDVFHAAIVGAPVTDWQLYDTFYTERYLGDPTVDRDVYVANSVLTDAARLERPLLLVHGLADDNVVAAHSLRFSSALLAAGRPHEMIPLSGVTHMTPQEEVAENLLLLQVAFLRRALAC